MREGERCMNQLGGEERRGRSSVVGCPFNGLECYIGERKGREEEGGG